MTQLVGASAIAAKLSELAGVTFSQWQVYRLAKRRNSPIQRDPDGVMLRASSSALAEWARQCAPIFAKQLDRRRGSSHPRVVEEELLIFGLIGDGELTDTAFDARLKALGDPKDLRVKINSEGGLVHHGLAIYHALRSHPARVTVEIVGVAASMASAIAMAGDHVVMAEDGLFMLHDPWTSAAGNAEDLRAAADMLDKHGGSLAAIYARKTGIAEDAIKEMMAKDGGEGSWLNAREALDLGFIDEILAPASARLPQQLPAAAVAKRIIRRGGRKMATATRKKTGNPAKRKALVTALSAAVAALVTDDTTKDDVIAKLAQAAELEEAAVKAILGGNPEGVTKEVLEAFAEALDVETDALVEAAQADGIEVEDEPEQTDPPTDQPATSLPAAAVQRAIQAQLRMQREVRSTAIRLGLPEEEANRIAENAISRSRANAEILSWLQRPENQRRIVSVNPHVTAGEDDRDKWLDGVSQWLVIKAGYRGLVEAHLKQREGKAARLDPGNFRGLRLIDIARDYLERQGISCRGMHPMDIARRALAPRADGSGLNTRSDFPVLLENVLHKLLMAAYETAPAQWRSVAAVGSVQDFRDHPRLRLGSLARLSQKLESGEFKQLHFPDAEKEKIRALTFGNIIGLSREAIVNDDVDGFARMVTMLGQAANRSVDIDVFALFAENGGLGPIMSDGNPLFDAAHSNIAASGGPPSTATFEAARVLMANQKDPSGEDFLNLRPDVFVGPIGLGGAARTAINAEFDFDAETSGGLGKFMKPNVVRDMLSTIVDTPRLTGDRWYLLANPAIAPVIEVVFLQGEEAPVIEAEEGFDYDGVRWRVRYDYGTKPIDWRGAVTNEGSSE